MKLIINEKQLSCIVNHKIKNKEIDEEDDSTTSSSTTPSSSTSSSSSSTSAGGSTQGYPQVDKWESGMVRGHANPLGITTWESGMVRGHANPLREWAPPPGTIRTTYVSLKTPNGDMLDVPRDSEIVFWKGDEDIVEIFGGKDPVTNAPVTPPTNLSEIKSKLSAGTLRSFVTKKDNNTYQQSMFKDRPTKGIWMLSKYFYAFPPSNPTGIQYNPENYAEYNSVLHSVTNFIINNPVEVAEIAASIAVGILTGGQSLWIQALAQAIVFAPDTIEELKSGNNVGALASLAIICLPYAGEALKVGLKVNYTALNALRPELEKLTTVSAVEKYINTFVKGESDNGVLLNRLLNQTPQQFESLIGKPLADGFKEEVASGKIKLSKIPITQRVWWNKLTKEGGLTAALVVGQMGYKAYNPIQITNYDVFNNIENVDGVDY